MSASFLVSPEGRAWLIANRKAADGNPQRAVRISRRRDPGSLSGCRGSSAACAGCDRGSRGFVGVDFIWDTERGHATILEINPRPTTSFVGLCRLLPAGLLARAWLEAFRSTASGRRRCSKVLFGLVHSGKPWYSMLPVSSPTFVSQSIHEQLTRPGSRSFRSPSTSAGPISRLRTAAARRSTIPFEVWKRPDELGAGDCERRGGAAACRSGRRDHDRRALRLLPDQGGRRGRGP